MLATSGVNESGGHAKRCLKTPSSHWIANPVSQAGSLDLQSKFWTVYVKPFRPSLTTAFIHTPGLDGATGLLNNDYKLMKVNR